MGITIISIKSVSQPIRPAWRKIPKETRAGIRSMLGTQNLRALRTFKITLFEKGDEQRHHQGYARTALLDSDLLNFEVVVQNPEGHLRRLTIQRIHKDAPFIRLI